MDTETAQRNAHLMCILYGTLLGAERADMLDQVTYQDLKVAMRQHCDERELGAMVAELYRLADTVKRIWSRQ